MTRFRVETQNWKHWPRTLVMLKEDDDGSVESLPYHPDDNHRTCTYLPDEHLNWWDGDDEEWECPECECLGGSEGVSCSKCGWTMLGGEYGWFGYEDADIPGYGIAKGALPIPLFRFCPNCGALVMMPVPTARRVGDA